MCVVLQKDVSSGGHLKVSSGLYFLHKNYSGDKRVFYYTKGYIAVLDEHLDVEVAHDDDPAIHVVLAENGLDVKGHWNVQQQQVYM